MLEVAAFWLLLGLPGYAFLRRFSPESLEAGFLGNVALAYLAAFALLSPVSIAGYLLHLPLAVLSVTVVVSVAVSAVWLGRQLWRGPRRLPKLSPLAIAVSLVIVADMVLGLRHGSNLSGDARYHIARVRLLLAQGFNDVDPLSASGLEQIYRTNLYHALLATVGQLARLHATDVWPYAWFWAKLVAAGSSYYLAWTLLRQRWLAWLSALAFVFWNAPSSVLPYPNTIAVYWLLALCLAFGIQAFSGHGGWRPALGLAATSLVLVQLHALYFVFSVMAVVPLLVLRLAWLQLRRRSGRREVVAALFAFWIGAPWLGWTAWERVQQLRSVPVPHAAASGAGPAQAVTAAPTPPPKRDWRSRGFVIHEDGRMSLASDGFLDPKSLNVQLLLALVAGLCSRRRREFGGLTVVVGVAFSLLYIPQVCTPLVHAAGAPWIVRRFAAVIPLVHLAVFPGALWLPLIERFSRVWLQTIIVVASGALAWHSGLDYGRWTRKQYFNDARDNMVLRDFVTWHAERNAFFRKTIPVGTVAAVALRAPRDFADFLIDCDCFPLAVPPRYGGRGVPDMSDRRRAVLRLLDPSASLHTRLLLLRRYRVRYLVYLGKSAPSPQALAIYEPIEVSLAHMRGTWVLKVDPGPPDKRN